MESWEFVEGYEVYIGCLSRLTVSNMNIMQCGMVTIIRVETVLTRVRVYNGEYVQGNSDAPAIQIF